MKNKSKILLIIATLIILIFSFILIAGYNGLYQKTFDYDSMNERVDSDYSILSDRSYQDGIVSFDISTNELNGFVNRKRIIKDITLNNEIYSLKALSLDSNNKQVMMNISKEDSKAMDILADFTIEYRDNELILHISPLSVGNDPLLVGNLTLRSLDLDTLVIPLKSEANDIYETIFFQLLDRSSSDLSITHTRRSIIIDLDVKSYNLTNNKELTSLNDTNYLPISHTKEGEKFLTFKQSQLVNNIVKANSITKLNNINYENQLFDDNGEAILRLKDSQSDFTFDSVIKLDTYTESKYTKTNFLELSPVSSYINLEIPQDLKEALSSTFNKYNIDYLHDYQVLSHQLKDQEIEFKVEQTSWTIMVYLNGSDLESGYDEYTGELFAKASEDITEMMSGLESSNINLIIETGGTLEWEMDGIRSDINQRFKVEDGKLIHLEDLEMKNMTDPQTLIDFGNYAIDSYPSEKYALLMWNHGGGSLYGFGVDEHFYGDSLTLDELEVALESISSNNRMKFEVIGFDACLMATLETADVCSPYANYLIASEETEPDYGWDYDRIFKTLADGDAYDGDSFGELVVSGFIDYSVEANQEEMLTLSVIDLSKTTKVIQSMDALITRISEDMDTSDESFNTVSRIIPQIKAFGGNTEYTGYTDHYDLENFAKKLTEYYPVEANKLIAAIDSAVIYKASGYLATDAGGLSFYLPFYDLYYEDQIDDMYAPVSFSDNYTMFMDYFVDYRMNSTFDSSDLAFNVNATVDPYLLTIEEQSLEYVSNVYMNVLAYSDTETSSYYRDLGFDAWVVETDSPGVYEDSFSFWPSLMGDYLPIQVVYHGDDYIEYETPIYLNGEQATMISAWLYDDERYVIFGARPYLDSVDDSNGIVDRNTIEFQDGDQVEILYDTYSMETSEWSFKALQSFEVDLDTFIIEDGQFSTGSYGIQFVIEDYNGEFTFTDLYEFDY